MDYVGRVVASEDGGMSGLDIGQKKGHDPRVNCRSWPLLEPSPLCPSPMTELPQWIATLPTHLLQHLNP